MMFKEYMSVLKPIWCPGCGDYAVLTCLAKAFAELDWSIENTAVITGIGCSSRLPGYLNTYGFNSIHGRAVPIATGLKVSRPDINVIVAGGDGDMFAIGGGHMAHVVRRNIDMTLIVMDNNIYGLTKGQASPTTPIGSKTATTIYGSISTPINTLKVMLGYGCSFVAQSSSVDPAHMTKTIVEAVKHKGFSYVNVLSPCVTYRGNEQYQIIKSNTLYLDENYDSSDEMSAWKLLTDPQKYPMGVIYKKPRPSYADKLEDLRGAAVGAKTVAIEDEIKLFQP
ncbi:MAG: 2-oxoacid:ferredoxin oxidoreductase subunit beta [Deltaproteobacteria bacterium]|nr:2-oxoacid:ferredoxin oxidoreductase subunit beta [Deltaproteobacteria bacterium]